MEAFPSAAVVGEEQEPEADLGDEERLGEDEDLGHDPARGPSPPRHREGRHTCHEAHRNDEESPDVMRR
jgi:hypothetical protein